MKSILIGLRLWLIFSTAGLADVLQPGIDVFLKGYTSLIKGHRVGLITNQTGVNIKGLSSIDLLYEHANIDLVALFAPEHGIRGVMEAGEKVRETVDSKTGLPIYSLYGGDDHRPPRVALDTIDTLIYDIQDVGSRAYTYIWSMAEAMAAAGESGKNFIVLDRPNPLSCQQIDGPVTEDKWQSFIGLYPIPRVYGLTAGELARYLNREYQLGCRLIVIPVAGYKRSMSWQDTNLTWMPPSPNIPTPESAYCFPATGTIGVMGIVDIGIGTAYPFQLISAPWLDGNHAAAYLNKQDLPGVRFKPYFYLPARGMFKGRKTQGIKFDVIDPKKFLPARTEIFILAYLQRYYPNHFVWRNDRLKSFDKAMGTSKIREGLVNGQTAQFIINSWSGDLSRFNRRVRPYLIYR